MKKHKNKKRTIKSKKISTKKKRQSRKNQIKKMSNKKKQIGGNSTVKCCVCNQKIDKLSNALIPLKCLNENKAKAHRICQDCWWDEKKGFALETAEHQCPGCKKNFPLTEIKQQEEVIDLIEDD